MRKFHGIVFGAMMLHWTAAAAGGGALEIEDPYAWSVPPGQANTAAFMRIVNRGVAARALVGAKSDAAEVVELHTHTMEGGMMKMRRTEGIDVPGDGVVNLEPGGSHVMLIGLKRDLTPGDTVDLSLTLDDGTVIEVGALVRAVQVTGHHHQ